MTRRETIDSIIFDIRNNNLNDPELRKLQQLYIQIENIYNDPTKLSQFMNVITTALLHERAPTFTGSPHSGLFRNFYSTFFNLLIDPSIHGSRDERAIVIRNSLRLNNLISHTVIEYDYYFNGAVVAKINTDIKNPRSIYKVQDFILIHRDRYLFVWNTKTHKKKMFTFPDTDPLPNIIYIHKPILYEDNKFSLGINVHNFNGEDELPLVTYIGLLDFNTGEQQYHRFIDAFRIYDIKLVQNTLLIGTEDSIRILDIYTLKEDRIRVYGAFFILPYDNSTKLIIYDVGSITFYNLQDRLFISTLKIRERSFGISDVMNIQFLNEDIFVVTTEGYIAIFDLKTRSLIKQVDIISLETESDQFSKYKTYIRKVIILEDKFIVQTLKRIFILDYDLNLKFTSPAIPDINFIDILPNDQLITIQENRSIKMWDFEGFGLHLLYVIEGESNAGILLFNGRIYALRNGQIVIYE